LEAQILDNPSAGNLEENWPNFFEQKKICEERELWIGRLRLGAIRRMRLSAGQIALAMEDYAAAIPDLEYVV